MKTQVRAASRKWFARAMAFMDTLRRFGPKQADEYRKRFRRQEKFATALMFVRAAERVVAR